MIIFGTPLIAQQVTLDREVKMLALGDSYTIGASVDINERWPHQFISAIRAMGFEGRDPDYIARSGWTTRDLILGINSMLDEDKSYNLVSILIGVNNQYRRIPVDTYEPDLRKIVDLALGVVNQETSRLMILSIPDYAYTPFGGGNARVSSEIDEYNEIKRKVADEYQIAFIDITPISREGLLKPSLVASDGLHPSAVQYGQWVEAIIPRIRFEGTSLRNSPDKLPDDDIWVYPNPARSTLHIDNFKDISRVCVFNASGMIVSDLMITALPAKIDLSHLESGVYTLWFYRENEEAVSRKTIIIQKP
jgi:lysophospholipase L1-like esterase